MLHDRTVSSPTVTSSSGNNRVDELMNTVSKLAIETQRHTGKKQKLFFPSSLCMCGHHWKVLPYSVWIYPLLIILHICV